MSNAHDIFLVPGQYESIQAAVAAIERPTTIVVAPGIYRESVVVAHKPYVVIQSAALSRRGVTLAGADGAAAVLLVDHSTVHLSGVHVRSNARMRGVSVRDAVISLQDCTVAGNRIANGNGAGMECRGSSVRIQKSTIAGNVIDGGDEIAGAGLFFDACQIEIAGSNIQTNAGYADRKARGGGISCEASRMRMWKSRVTDNILAAPDCAGAGIYVRASVRCDLGGSVISGNDQSTGRGGGICIDGDPKRVAVHRNTVVRQNHPDDIYCAPPPPLDVIAFDP
ncbi:MAG: right-handed parallel beta-helix repeat-containing protein [Thermoanaerobaculia bacterium]